MAIGTKVSWIIVGFEIDLLVNCPFYGKFVEEEPEDQERRGNTRMAYNTAGGKLLTPKYRRCCFAAEL